MQELRLGHRQIIIHSAYSVLHEVYVELYVM